MWNDDYLAWNELPNLELYEIRNAAQFSAKLIWFPNIQLLNTLDNKKKITIDDSSIVKIDSEGRVSAMLFVQFSSDCKLQFDLYGSLANITVYLQILGNFLIWNVWKS